ncbi:MAG: ATP-binding protein [Deltaproteobacteria bacterium]|nr:ATP-binding protein [Deltaproteobacteria bacterium]
MLKETFYSFRARVFWLTALLVLMLSISFTAVVIYQQERLLKQELVSSGLKLSRNIAHDIQLSVFTEDTDFLKNAVMQHIDTEGDVVYAAVYSLNLKPIFNYSSKKGISVPPITEEIKKQIDLSAVAQAGKTQSWQDRGHIYEFWATVVLSGGFKGEDIVTEGTKVIGIVRLGISTKGVDARVKNIIWTSISITIIFLVFSLILTYLLTKRVTGPLFRLKEAVESIERGGAYEGININSNDEIGELASSFNNMVSALNKKDNEIMQHVKELSALNTVASTVNQSLDLKETLNDGLKEILKLTNMEAGWIFLLSEDGSALKVSAHAGVEDSFIQKIDFLKPGEGLAGKVALSGEAIIEEDISGDHRISRGAVFEEGFKAFASIPLRSKTRTLGVMNITSRMAHPFTTDEVELFYSIGNQMGTAVENSQLYGQLKKQLEEIERTQDQLIRSARLASLGELSTNVAHEINNPLTAILSYTAIMLENAPDTDPNREKLKIIYDETMRIRYIVRNLLDFARQTEPRRYNCCAADVTKDTLNLIRHLAKVANVEIVEEYAPHMPMVSIDINQIKQALLNIFNNALYAMPNGGILKAAVEEGNGWIKIHIHDTGAGIPKDIIHKIFDPLFTTKHETNGAGLGLSVSHGIIERHGGEIEVKSEHGKGSIFTIKLPIA